jgi:hypothetical protein
MNILTSHSRRVPADCHRAQPCLVPVLLPGPRGRARFDGSWRDLTSGNTREVHR